MPNHGNSFHGRWAPMLFILRPFILMTKREKSECELFASLVKYKYSFFGYFLGLENNS